MCLHSHRAVLQMSSRTGWHGHQNETCKTSSYCHMLCDPFRWQNTVTCFSLNGLCQDLVQVFCKLVCVLCFYQAVVVGLLQYLCGKDLTCQMSAQTEGI